MVRVLVLGWRYIPAMLVRLRFSLFSVAADRNVQRTFKRSISFILRITILTTHITLCFTRLQEPEDIDINPFFVTLSSKHSKLYAAAQEQCCLILVPAAMLLKGVPISLPLIEAHVYKPSPFFQGQYVNFAGKISRTIALEGTSLNCVSGFEYPTDARVLSEVGSWCG